MKESYVKGLANHNGLESCGGWSNPSVEALTEGTAGWVLSCEKPQVLDADLVGGWGRQQSTNRKGEGRWYLAQSETPGRRGNNLHGNREILSPPRPARLGRIEKSKDVRR